MTYRIKDWDEHYENNRTRDMKEMRWVPIPCKLDGDGYTTIMEKKNGASIYGAWIACVIVASSCGERGTLLRSNKTPHDTASLARITRIPKPIIKEMLDICTKECKWIEIIDLQEGAEIPQEGAGCLRGIEGNRIEENRREENRIEESPCSPLDEAMASFRDMRKKIRKPLTTKAESLIVKKLNSMESNESGKIAILEQSIMNSWQGIFPLNDGKSKKFGRQEVSRETIKKNMEEAVRIMEAKNG